jgi:hypothetical protein
VRVRADRTVVGRRPVRSGSARRRGVTAPAVSHSQRRYQGRGLAALHDELRPGRARTHDDAQVAELIRLVTQRKPEPAAHWSVQPGGRGHRHLQEHGGPLFCAVGSLAASRQELQALDRCVLRGEDARNRGSVSLSAGQGAGAVRRRKDHVQPLERANRCCRWGWATWKG